ncbi:Fe(3+) ABC transporter substrate-binding protein [Ectopseudomonas hydrolytica]|uniref:Fe(3+) ABC transporter substrate-binding protein n=1 Tax=Ectopseudomonas hydrolytica TaxID=2493633 RepID=A0ABY5A1V9_9GAMM|nr:Fe(3+) ABC transporter substrate-binding protein [Pseudomonas hydrolytica]OCX15298.1 iron ABC transporter substrate-binding protein [Stutzerimonas xanthomarina]USR37661.1 Fe(3+) ABC transporter substrate-binding protein [Pseudomonas hydrolytica]
MSKRFLPTQLAAAALAATTAMAAPHALAEEVNLYTTREATLIQPLLDAFTKESGIQVKTIFIVEGLLERVQAEGQRSPADVLMTVDIGNLLDLVDGGVTQPLQSPTLEQVIPANLRGQDGQWFALSLRDRVLYADKDLPISSFTYEELADPKWKGKVCIRSGQHPYNTALIAAKIAHDGAEATQAWLEGVKQNLARTATGGDRNVARDILGGICDIGIANAYYVGQMKNAAEGSEDRAWGNAIKVVRPTFANSTDGGTHVNITGASLAKNAPNRDNAVKFLEYLVSPAAQAIYANANYEYPVRDGVQVDPVMAALGPLKVDTLNIAEVAKYRKQASELVDKVGFDN